MLGPAVVWMIPEGFAHFDSVGRAAGGVCWGHRGSLKGLAMAGDEFLGCTRKRSVCSCRHGGEIKVNSHKSNNELMRLCIGWKRIGVLYVCDACVWVSMM